MTQNNSIKIPEVPCQLMELKLSCWGCCGNDLKGQKLIEKDIKQNTIDLEEIYDSDNIEKSLKEYRDRFASWDLGKSGACLNLVDFGDGCLACPLHPLINKIVSKEKYIGPKNDLRINHCDVNYECPTFKTWKIMSNEQKIEFVEWVKTNKKDHYTYSIGNVEGTLIKKFFEEKYPTEN